MPLQVHLAVTSDAALLYLDKMPKKLQERLNTEMKTIADMLYERVVENLSGKILRIKSGQLVNSIVEDVTTTLFETTATIRPVPVTAKSLALEFGSREYQIEAKNYPYLVFFWEKENKWMRIKRVTHPQMKGFFYLREAFEALEPIIEGSFIRASEEGIAP